jgi:RNA polymerase sigma-70 factor (ECF subfamily)
MTSPLAGFEDNALIQLTLAGHTDCFTVLVNRHQAALKRCIFSMMRNRADSEDVMQDVPLKMWRYLPAFRAESSFRTWITRVARNEVLQFYRRQTVQRISSTPVDFEAFPSPHGSTHRSLASNETARTIRSAIAALPGKYSQVLILRDLNELSLRETAQCLELTISALKSRLFRARLMRAALRSGYSPKSLAECGRLAGRTGDSAVCDAAAA